MSQTPPPVKEPAEQPTQPDVPNEPEQPAEQNAAELAAEQ